MAYNETSNVATNDIPAGAYVFWNNGAYKASQNISYGDTLSSANLTAIEDSQNQSCGFANDINSNLKPQYSDTNYSRYIKMPGGALICMKCVTFNNLTVDSAWGSMYQAQNLSLGNWAYPFAYKPIVLANVTTSEGGGTQTGGQAVVVKVQGVSTTSAGNCSIMRPTSSTDTFSVTILGIGQWQ